MFLPSLTATCQLCTVSLKAGLNTYKGLAGLNHIRFEFIRRRRAMPWDKEGWVRYVQAEVLVPECIPLENVLRVVFVSAASRQEAERLWGNHSHPEFIVNPAYFENISPQGDATLNFSVLHEWYLTDSTIDRSNVKESRAHQPHFQKYEGSHITAVAHVNAFSGTRGSFIWEPGSHKFEGEFETSGDYWQWASIDMNNFPEGPGTVTYLLGEIRWATFPFYITSS